MPEVSGLSGTVSGSMARCSPEAAKPSRSGAGYETTGRNVAMAKRITWFQAAEILGISTARHLSWLPSAATPTAPIGTE
jgi:hypothetical protein